MALDMGGITPILYAFIERDEIVEMLAAVTGQRMLFNYMRIGGVNGDLNHEFLSRLGRMDGSRGGADRGEHDAHQRERDLRGPHPRPGRHRPRDGPPDGAALGPCFAPPASPYDVRRAHPYGVYPELDFDVPVREEGDSYARFLLHVDEVKQSIHIIDQVIHEMPDGPCMAKIPRLIRPRPGRAWAAVESPRGQYGCYAISDGTDQPFRFRIHDPSFVNLQVLPDLLRGHLLADNDAVFASLDPIMGGIDK